MSWLCICGTTNASANTHCAADRTLKSIPHYQITASTWDESLLWTQERRVNSIMTPNEELHAKFFREEAELVINLSDVELEEHIQELEMIVREGKARVIASNEEKRNRRAKSKSGGEWQIAPTGPDVTVTDSLNKVKQRTARMSKLDKIRDKLEALGISDKEIDQMVSKMVAQARKDKPEPAPINTGITTDEQRQSMKDSKAKLDGVVGQTEPLIQPIVTPAAEYTNTQPLDISKLKFT